jgi:hypothetical protein
MHEPPPHRTKKRNVKPPRDVETFSDAHEPEIEEWFKDERYARYALQDGEFEKYRGYVIAIYEKKVVGKGKNPLHLRTRIAKKLGIPPCE